MRIVPTDYQREALEQIRIAKHIGRNKILIQLASGLGKTYLSAFESLNYKGKILFLCHRTEILTQAKESFNRLYEQGRTNQTKFDLYKGKKKKKDSRIVFASVQTLARKKNLETFAKNEFELIIIDECHHAMAPSYINILNYFEPKTWLGLSATPFRLGDPDGEKILSLFGGKLIYSYDLIEAIDNEKLTPFILIFQKDNVDYSKIKYGNYSYNEKDLDKSLVIPERNKEILEQYKRSFANRKTIGFCVNIKHAIQMKNLFNKNNISSEAITYKTSFEERKIIEAKFRNGSVKVLFTRDIYNEGIDIPDVDGIMLLRPTCSKVIFLQQIGRGLRKSYMKKDVVVLDFVGNYVNAMSHQVWLSKSINKHDIKREGKPEYVYPLNCKVVFSQEVVDLFNFMKPISEKDLIQNYYDLKQKLGRRPTSSDMLKAKLWLGNYQRLFGSWQEFLKHIGEPLFRDNSIKSKEFLVKAYEDLQIQMGKQPTANSFQYYSAVASVFSSWNNFLRYMNQPLLKSDKGTRRPISSDKKKLYRKAYFKKNPDKKKLYQNKTKKYHFWLNQNK